MEEPPSEYGASLEPPAPRTHVHTRKAEYRGFHRVDGLWDIEAELTDTKMYVHQRPDGGVLPAGGPVHGMTIRLTVDDHMKIVAVSVGMPATPFSECQQARPPLQRLIGCTLGRGWRRTIEEKLGTTRSCAHLRELLFNMATVGYQTIPLYKRHMRERAGVAEPPLDRPPPHFGQCIAWDFNGAVMKRLRPEFAGSAQKKN